MSRLEVFNGKLRLVLLKTNNPTEMETSLSSSFPRSHITVGPTVEPSLSGERSTAPRAKQLFNLLLPLAHLLPTDISIHASDHDLGSWILGDDQRQLALTRINTAKKADGTGLNQVKFFSPNDLKRLEDRKRNGHPGWFVSFWIWAL